MVVLCSSPDFLPCFFSMLSPQRFSPCSPEYLSHSPTARDPSRSPCCLPVIICYAAPPLPDVDLCTIPIAYPVLYPIACTTRISSLPRMESCCVCPGPYACKGYFDPDRGYHARAAPSTCICSTWRKFGEASPTADRGSIRNQGYAWLPLT